MSTTIMLSQTKIITAIIFALALVEGHSLDGDDGMHPRYARPSGFLNKRTGQVKAFEDKEHWFNNAQSMLKSKLDVSAMIESEAKNIIFFLGDGMSINTVTAARILKGQFEKAEYGGEEASLHFDTFPHIGVSKTFCSDAQVADSACSATAYLCGTKANDGTIGVTPSVLRKDDCRKQDDPQYQVKSVLAWAQAAGMSTGVVTTTRVTHASPAGTYAHINDRDWENNAIMAGHGQNHTACGDIAEQLIRNEPGKNIDVILGGGRREFTPNTQGDRENSTVMGRRTDDADLIKEWQDLHNETGSKFIWTVTDLLALDRNVTNVDRVLGLFAYDHIAYNDSQQADADPTLEQMTQLAIKILSKNPKGFFLFVEGGRIDHAHHDSRGKRALIETIEFDKAIQRADALTDDSDTLILVTSDHSHTMTINGYPDRGNPLMGMIVNTLEGGWQVGSDKLPMTTLSYANGPGYQNATVLPDGISTRRYNVSGDDFESLDYRQVSTVPLGSETHGGDDVLIFSKGPFAHLLTGVQMQSYIPHVLGYAACIGNGTKYDQCYSRNPRPEGDGAASLTAFSTLGVLLLVSIAQFLY